MFSLTFVAAGIRVLVAFGSWERKMWQWMKKDKILTAMIVCGLLVMSVAAVQQFSATDGSPQDFFKAVEERLARGS